LPPVNTFFKYYFSNTDMHMHMYVVCCEQETAFIGELRTERCYSTVVIADWLICKGKW